MSEGSCAGSLSADTPNRVPGAHGYSYEFIYLVLCCLQDCGIRLRTAEQNLQLELYFIGLEHRLANRAVLKGRGVPWR